MMRKLLLQLVTGPTTKCLDYKEHDEFEVAFKLYFLHSSTRIGGTCVSVWIQEGWIEWLATLF